MFMIKEQLINQQSILLYRIHGCPCVIVSLIAGEMLSAIIESDSVNIHDPINPHANNNKK